MGRNRNYARFYITFNFILVSFLIFFYLLFFVYFKPDSDYPGTEDLAAARTALLARLESSSLADAWPPGEWTACVDRIVRYADWLTDNDKKISSFKLLQGMDYHDAYARGEISAPYDLRILR